MESIDTDRKKTFWILGVNSESHVQSKLFFTLVFCAGISYLNTSVSD